MLEQITVQDIQIGIKADNWEDAIRQCAQPLLTKDKIKPEYIEAMIDAVHRVGPYIVLGRNVALAHARPECGVKELAVCFSTLNSPITFGSEHFDPVKLMITLAAIDENSHLDLMSELAEVLMEEENIDSLAESKSAEEFRSILLRAISEE